MGLVRINNLSEQPVIYLIQFDSESFLKMFKIEQQNWKQKFVEFWNDENINKEDESMPRVNEANLNTKTNFTGWIDLYVGKRLKVKSRLVEHLKKSPSKKTGALKLDKRINIHNGLKFRILTLTFDKINTEIELITCKVLEDTIRDLRKPILGRK